MLDTTKEKYKIKLEIFEGPLDLLLHLVKESELDIYNIPIAQVTEQYLEYLELMQSLDLDIAGEFIVMAATLMSIKARMLVPRINDEEDESEEDDPRRELVQRLLEYKKFKEVVKTFRGLEDIQKSTFTRPEFSVSKESDENSVFEMNLFDLISAFNKVIKKLPKEVFREITKDETTVEEKVDELKLRLGENREILFTDLLRHLRSKIQIVCLFLAILELTKRKFIRVYQVHNCDEIKIVRREDAPVQSDPEPIEKDLVPDEETGADKTVEQVVLEEDVEEEVVEQTKGEY